VNTISTGARLMEKAPYLQACMRPHIYLQVLDAYLLYPPKGKNRGAAFRFEQRRTLRA
jgi:hypothetical protein